MRRSRALFSKRFCLFYSSIIHNTRFIEIVQSCTKFKELTNKIAVTLHGGVGFIYHQTVWKYCILRNWFTIHGFLLRLQWEITKKMLLNVHITIAIEFIVSIGYINVGISFIFLCTIFVFFKSTYRLLFLTCALLSQVTF